MQLATLRATRSSADTRAHPHDRHRSTGLVVRHAAASGAHQKLLAFASLIALMVVLHRSPRRTSCRPTNIVAILQATAVNGVLAIACTFVIITGGIDLSVGTLMTFCAVMAGVVLTYWGLPLPLGIVAAIVAGALCGLRLGRADRQAEDPALHRHAGHDADAQGPVAGDLGHQADLLQRHAEASPLISPDSLIGTLVPAAADPERRADPVRRRRAAPAWS